MSEALIAPTYGEAFEIRRHFKLLNGTTLALDYLLATVPPTGAQLEAWLATDANLVAFQRLIATAAGASAICAGANAMAAVVGSATALANLRDSDTGRAALINSKTAMAAVMASATAPAALLVSAAFRAAIYDNEGAWTPFIAKASVRSALNDLAVEHISTVATHTYPTASGPGIRVVLVQRRTAVSGAPQSFAGAGFDTYVTTSTTYIDRYVRVTGLTHRASSSGITSAVRYVLMQ